MHQKVECRHPSGALFLYNSMCYIKECVILFALHRFANENYIYFINKWHIEDFTVYS